MEREDIAQIERELQRKHDALKRQTSYETFGIWEGCGSAVVKERYYALVKENHPDRYGGNVSDKVKNLSQEIFLQIQKSFKQLLKVETVQRTPDPATRDANRSAALDRLSKLSNPQEEARSTEQEATSRDEVEPRASVSSLRGPAPEMGMSVASEVFEAVTISTRDADTLDEDSMPEEERRAKLARLARLARNKPLSPSLPPVRPKREIHHTPTKQTSPEDRRAKLAALAAKRSPPPTTRPVTRPSVRAPNESNPVILQTQTASHPDEPQTPKDHFNRGYNEFRIKNRPKIAFEHLKIAYEAEPTNALYGVFYGYVLFLTQPEERSEAERIIKEALDSGDKQASPDGHLFMGYILKTYDSDKKLQLSHRHFMKALQLNPASHEAEREIRLYNKRQQQQAAVRPQDDVGAFLGKLFKK